MPIFLKGNHQLESRMQEICQSGSEGGAKLTFVPTPISAQEPVVFEGGLGPKGLGNLAQGFSPDNPRWWSPSMPCYF
jgi:hypothetical protein